MATPNLKCLLVMALSTSLFYFAGSSFFKVYAVAPVEFDEQEHASKIEAYKKKKTELQDKLDTIDKLKANQGNFALLLAEYKSKGNPLVWTTSLTYKKDVVTVKGYGVTLTAIGDFIEALQSSKYFSSVEYQNTACYVETPSIYPINLRFRFDADPERTHR